MLLLTIFIILVALSYPKKDNDIGVRFVMIILGFVSIILSYRASDFPNYRAFYDSIEPIYLVFIGDDKFFQNNNDEFEFAYKLLNSFFKVISPYVEVMYICCNILMLIVVYRFFRNRSENFYKLFLPYFTFIFITVQVGIIRQALAISIFYISIFYIEERKLIKYLVSTFIAFLFHSTAILLLPLYFFINKVYSNRALIITFLIGLLMYVNIIPINLTSILESVADFAFPQIGNKLVFYIFESQQLNAPSKLNLGIFENTIMFCLLLYVRSQLKDINRWTSFLNICLNLSMIYIFLYIYVFDFFNVVYRINYYFIIFKFFIIIAYIESIKTFSYKFILHLILVLYCLIMLFIRISTGF